MKNKYNPNNKRRDLRVLVSTNGLHTHSGYGVEARDLIVRLVKDGWPIAVSSFFGIQGRWTTYEYPDNLNSKYTGVKVRQYPAMGDPFGGDAMVAHGVDWKANVIVTFQDLPPLHPQNLQQMKTFIPWVPIDKSPTPPPVLERLKFANRIITLAQFGTDELLKSNFTSRCIKEGVDTEIFKPADKKEARKRMGLPEEMFLVGMVGANKENPPRKGWQEALEAFSRFCKDKPEARIIIATQQMAPGNFPIREYLTYLGVINKAIFVNDYQQIFSFDSTDIANYYNACDFLLHPSQTEGFGLCFHPETKVLTKEGMKAIYLVEPGEEVISHKGIYKKVTKKMTRPVKENLIRIKISGVPDSILATAEHPFWGVSRKTKKLKIAEPEWIEASNLKKGDLVAFTLPTPEYANVTFDLADFDPNIQRSDDKVWYKMGYSGKTNQLCYYSRYIPLNNEISKLLGLYIAEGSTNKNQRSSIEFSFGNEPELATLVTKLVKKYFGVDAKTIKMDTKIRVIISGSIIAKFFSTLAGLGAANKKIPAEILLNKDKSILKDCLNYVGIGDGWENPTGNLVFHLGSESLTTDIYLASLLLGWKISCQRSKTGSYHSYITKNGDSSHSNKSWIKGNIVYTLVTIVDRVPYEGDVFNLEVEDDHSYQVWGSAVHNCITESQSCGTPVIINNTTSMPELVVDGLTGYICKTQAQAKGVPGRFTNDLSFVYPADVDSLTEKMEFLYNDLKAGEEVISKACRDHIIKNFNIDETAKKWGLLLEELQDELLPLTVSPQPVTI